MLKFLRGLILDNFAIKIFSFAFAIILWLQVVARGTTEVNFVVPLELRDIPPNMMVVGDVPGYVDVRLQGQEGMVKRLAVRDISAFISLTGAGPGEVYFPLTADNVTVPGSIRLVSITPSGVNLRLEKMVRKALAIRPRLAGRPANGLHVTKVEVVPLSVNAAGPEGSLGRINSVYTEDIDLDGAKGSFDRLVRIEPPPGYGVKLDEDNARVTVTLSRTKTQAGE